MSHKIKLKLVNFSHTFIPYYFTLMELNHLLIVKEDTEEERQYFISHAEGIYINTVITKHCVNKNKSKEILALLNICS